MRALLLALGLSAASSCTTLPPRDASGPAESPAAPAEAADPAEGRPGAAAETLAAAASRGPAQAHERLSPLAGEWDVVIEGVTRSGGPLVALARGRARIAWVLDDRFLRFDIALDFDGQPHESVGYVGYDLDTGEYQALWLSDLLTGMTLLRGSGDPSGAGIVFIGRSASGEGQSRMRLVAPDELLVEGFGVGRGGRPVLVRRSRYTRVRR